MPAGNDAAKAATELADKFGGGEGNADEMIKASRLRYAGDLGKAQLMPVEDVEVDLDALASAVGVKTVIAATVRGPYVVYSFEDEEGRTQKGATELSELDTKKPKAEKAEKAEKPKAKAASK